MRGLLKRLITEPGADSAEDYARRVQILAATYAVLFCASVAGVVVLAIYGKLFVTLAQRSNVETLTILFLLVLYAYLATISASGALGAARLGFYALRRRSAREPVAERRRQLGKLDARADGPWAALAKVLDRTDGAPLRFDLSDEALLPDWEYQAEHKLPVIPEPLGFVSLGRSAKRADPVATMGFATLMVLLTLAVIVLFVLDKPWVPG
ncbi:MAG: hypothetical protein E6J82_11505 [Deltaproteobacteria bacterium]|nr:MAG: hypothetical protein E6J82_11505 [Deltaproteobacteria bacterium]